MDLAHAPSPVAPDAATPDAVMSERDFCDCVAARAAVAPAAARRATAAVLETLAEGIPRAELDEVEARLPGELHEPLRRGGQRAGDAGREPDLDAFLALVADLSGAERDDAADHARAVLATLREAIGDAAFHAVGACLPREFASLLATASA